MNHQQRAKINRQREIDSGRPAPHKAGLNAYLNDRGEIIGWDSSMADEASVKMWKSTRRFF